MRRVRVLLSVLAVLASILVLAAPAIAAGPTCTVDGGGGGDYTTIQAAIDDTACTTIEVASGAYSENLTIDRNLTMVSTGGRAVTTITGTTDGSLGTVRVTGGTSAVQIGETNQGFTIGGIDNPSPGIESAAVYFQGSHSNAVIRDNEIVADGDHGLLTEYGATITGFVIDGNEFSGQTFVGPNPAGNGFGQQFTLANVPRQLVTMGGGSGGGNTSNTTFTNNTITGTAGGTNGGGEQGNTLVTVDSNGATITGNVFAGTTSRFATSLRARGPLTTISGNTFDSTGITFPAGLTGHVFIQNTGELVSEVVAANTFDKGVWVEGSVGTIGISIEAFVEPAPDGTTVHVLPGAYAEGRPQVVVDTDITLLGTDRATTIVTPLASTGAGGDARGWFLIDPAANLDVSHMTFDGAGFQIYQGFRHKGTGTFDTVAFANMAYSTYVGQAIAAFGEVGPVNVLNSTFDNMERIGVLYFGAGTTGDFVGNTYTGKGVGDWLDYALDISNGAVVNVVDNTVTGNRGTASSDGSASAGFLVSTFFGPGTTATFTGNVIDDNTIGIAIGFNGSDTSTALMDHNVISNNDFGITIEADGAAAASSANRNAITGNGAGVDNDSTTVFDATCNWWGDGFGPSGFGPGGGDSVSDFVDFSAWLISSDLDGACIGGGNMAAKQVARDALAAALPSGDKDTDKRYEKAIESTDKSLTPAYWVDDVTLDPKDGKKVFDEEKKAAKELMKLEGDSLADLVIQQLVSIDETLAQAAIDAATLAGGDQKDLDKAAERMAKAADAIADGDFDKAIGEYKKAWEEAQKSVG